MTRRPFLLALLATGTLSGPLAAQAPRLTLAAALARADASAYGNRAARASATAGSSRALGALQGMLPTFRVEGGWVRSTEPLTAFGLLLRQRGVTPAAFAPNTLNDPEPRSNWNGGLVAEVPLLNADAWAGRAAASAGAASASADAAWRAAQTRVDVIRAYYGAVLAAEAVHTLEAADAAANDHVRQAQSMLAQGMVTRSDLLLAQVRAGEVSAQLIGARAQAGLARRQLALTLGTPDDTLDALPDSLPATAAIHALADTLTKGSDAPRSDVRAATEAATAAGRDATRAKARMLPRLNAFGRYDWNASNAPFRGPKSWTVGVMASWSPFSGMAEVADARGAGARADAARAMADAAEAQAALERSARDADLAVALARLDIAEQAVAQGAEAHRLVERRYAGGLASVTDLLGAQATETGTRLGLADARLTAITAIAARQLAHGADPAALAALEN